jgi:ligand-binding SRPBCC domain-containing protein
MAAPSIVERSVEIAVPVEAVFAFHLDTRNAPLISPRGTEISDVEGAFPVAPGAVVAMRMRPRPMPFASRWRIRIEEVHAPERIVDVAERSPFSEWRHEHLFVALADGRTRMTDRVVYRLPGGRLGRLADRLILRRRLESAFAERHRRTRDLLEERARASAAA